MLLLLLRSCARTWLNEEQKKCWLVSHRCWALDQLSLSIIRAKVSLSAAVLRHRFWSLQEMEPERFTTVNRRRTRRCPEIGQPFLIYLGLWKINQLFWDFQNLIDLLLLVLHHRVGIWPPPQRAPASAVVRPDRPTHHEPEEWGRGGASPHCRLGFRWVICPFHENHDLGSVCPCQTIPQESRG